MAASLVSAFLQELGLVDDAICEYMCGLLDSAEEDDAALSTCIELLDGACPGWAQEADKLPRLLGLLARHKVACPPARCHVRHQVCAHSCPHARACQALSSTTAAAPDEGQPGCASERRQDSGLRAGSSSCPAGERTSSARVSRDEPRADEPPADVAQLAVLCPCEVSGAFLAHLLRLHGSLEVRCREVVAAAPVGVH